MNYTSEITDYLHAICSILCFSIMHYIMYKESTYYNIHMYTYTHCLYCIYVLCVNMHTSKYEYRYQYRIYMYISLKFVDVFYTLYMQCMLYIYILSHIKVYKYIYI